VTIKEANNAQELVEMIGLGDTVAQLSRAVWKGTESGVSIMVNEAGVLASAICEGVEGGVSRFAEWPVNENEFWELTQAADEEAGALWDLTHGCHVCAGVSEEVWENEHIGTTQVNATCENCDGDGVVI
jgi:hypothetical protein